MIKYNVVGKTYNEWAIDIYSKLERKPRDLIPVFDDSPVDIIFYVDTHVLACDKFDKKNFGWLSESAAIVPHIYEQFVNRFDEVIQNYQMIFTHSRELVSRHEKIKWVPASATWIKNPKIYKNKQKRISMITSAKNFCPGHTSRLQFLIDNQDHLDLYGIGFREIPKKEDGLRNYMFSVAHENATYPGYFTEKILDCFASGTIPIYRGDPEIGKVFNTDGIVFIDDNLNLNSLNEDFYYSKMNAIEENLNIVKNNFMRVENYIYDNYLKELYGSLL